MDIDKLKRALALMTEALALLDETEISPDVGAHLDLAVNVLQDAMGPFGYEDSSSRPASYGR